MALFGQFYFGAVQKGHLALSVTLTVLQRPLARSVLCAVLRLVVSWVTEGISLEAKRRTRIKKAERGMARTDGCKI